MITTPEAWQPKGINDLESAAWEALRHLGSACIVAGPGAGKTEFLAQKAAFLLETGSCRAPLRILAISFKKDAAENLAGRVKKRCRPEEASRFDSFTFDAFTKGLVDRFKLALPEDWRPANGYDIPIINDRAYQGFLDNMRDRNQQRQHAIASIRASDFKNKILGTHQLSGEKPTTLEDALARFWFQRMRTQGNPDFLTLNRLAEWIIRSVPTVRRAIQQTYPFVFVDEFQDTTFAQYDFLYSLFCGSWSSITAVGDNKQRIMVWAGAKPEAFNEFTQDYSASRFDLTMNYRSSPGLVAIQHYLARSLEPDCIEPRSGIKQAISHEFAQIWNFSAAENEYRQIACWIAQDMESRNLQPEDYAILVRQTGDRFYNAMNPEFMTVGLTLRNEGARYGKMTLQDIVHDELFGFISAILRLSIQKTSPLSWTKASNFMTSIFGGRGHIMDGRGQDGSLGCLLNTNLRKQFGAYHEGAEIVEELVDEIVAFLGIDTIRGAFPYYASGDNFDTILDAIKEYLKSCALGSSSWREFLNLMDGKGQIPLLTIHKSKGLEYDTTIFVGLDDQAWWSYTADNPEGKATFFVALSRAKQRVIFTYSKGQGGRRKISDLYDLLKEAGVVETSF